MTLASDSIMASRGTSCAAKASPWSSPITSRVWTTDPGTASHEQGVHKSSAVICYHWLFIIDDYCLAIVDDPSLFMSFIVDDSLITLIIYYWWLYIDNWDCANIRTLKILIHGQQFPNRQWSVLGAEGAQPLLTDLIDRPKPPAATLSRKCQLIGWWLHSPSEMSEWTFWKHHKTKKQNAYLLNDQPLALANCSIEGLWLCSTVACQRETCLVVACLQLRLESECQEIMQNQLAVQIP